MDPQEQREALQQAAVLQGRLEALERLVLLAQQELREAKELLGELVLQVREAQQAPPEVSDPRGQ